MLERAELIRSECATACEAIEAAFRAALDLDHLDQGIVTAALARILCIRRVEKEQPAATVRVVRNRQRFATEVGLGTVGVESRPQLRAHFRGGCAFGRRLEVARRYTRDVGVSKNHVAMHREEATGPGLRGVFVPDERGELARCAAIIGLFGRGLGLAPWRQCCAETVRAGVFA